MLGRAGGQAKFFAQHRRRAKSHGRFHDDAAASRPYRSPIASATLVQVAKSMDARNVRARRTAVITDLLPDTFLGLLLGKAEALCAVLSPRRNTLCQHWVRTQCGQGPCGERPEAWHLGDIFSPLRVPFLVYIIPELIRQEFAAEIAVSVFGCRFGWPLRFRLGHSGNPGHIRSAAGCWRSMPCRFWNATRRSSCLATP